jgi:hypothetical protein
MSSTIALTCLVITARALAQAITRSVRGAARAALRFAALAPCVTFRMERGVDGRGEEFKVLNPVVVLDAVPVVDVLTPRQLSPQMRLYNDAMLKARRLPDVDVTSSRVAVSCVGLPNATLDHVSGWARQCQVVNGIVHGVAVYVIDVFAARQATAHLLLYQVAVFLNTATPWDVDRWIALFQNSPVAAQRFRHFLAVRFLPIWIRQPVGFPSRRHPCFSLAGFRVPLWESSRHTVSVA